MISVFILAIICGRVLALLQTRTSSKLPLKYWVPPGLEPMAIRALVPVDEVPPPVVAARVPLINTSTVCVDAVQRVATWDHSPIGSVGVVATLKVVPPETT